MLEDFIRISSALTVEKPSKSICAFVALKESKNGQFERFEFSGKSIPPPEDAPDEECQLQTDVKAEGECCISYQLHFTCQHFI